MEGGWGDWRKAEGWGAVGGATSYGHLQPLPHPFKNVLILAVSSPRSGAAIMWRRSSQLKAPPQMWRVICTDAVYA